MITVTAAQVSGGRDLAPNNATDLTPGDYVRIEVSDTGCGMTEEVRAKIFDPFFSTKFPGRGLGLAVVQGIVRDLGGAINIVSAPGQGTAFQVLLPCALPRELRRSTVRSHSAAGKVQCYRLRPSLWWRMKNTAASCLNGTPEARFLGNRGQRWICCTRPDTCTKMKLMWSCSMSRYLGHPAGRSLKRPSEYGLT